MDKEIITDWDNLIEALFVHVDIIMKPIILYN